MREERATGKERSLVNDHAENVIFYAAIGDLVINSILGVPYRGRNNCRKFQNLERETRKDDSIIIISKRHPHLCETLIILESKDFAVKKSADKECR